MSGDGRHIYCSCYMANVGLLRSTDFLETAEPFKPLVAILSVSSAAALFV